MEASTGLFTSSHDSNELVAIQGHDEPKHVKNLDGQLCEICGDSVGVTVDGDLFVACEECGFPVCRPCYEYERREGTQVCPQCHTRYKRIKGSPRVDGDEDEDDVDDIEQEFKMVEEKYKLMHGEILPGKKSTGDDDENAKLALVNEELPISSYIIGEPGSVKLDDRVRTHDWKLHQGNLLIETDASDDPEKAMKEETRQPLSRKVAIPSGKLSPYRMMVVARLIILILFFQYRIFHPVSDAVGLWFVSVVCEIWLALSWLLDQLPKWFPIDRETYLDRLSISGGQEGNELPCLAYISREKRPGFQHHSKAGAMNALLRVSAVLSNSPFVLNLDCNHYVNNSKAVREAMCFFMDIQLGNSIGFVQFPHRFDSLDRNDRYANKNTVLFDITLRCLDGIQGPVYVGSGCIFRRKALYGFDPPKAMKRPRLVQVHSKQDENVEDASITVTGADEDNKQLLKSEMNFESKFGKSELFVNSSLTEEGGIDPSSGQAALLKEAIHVMSCTYEDRTLWGYEVGLNYGSIASDILTSFKIHTHGWRSIYCMPKRPAFRGTAPINLTDRLNQVLRWAVGSLEILFSHHCPIWYGFNEGRLKGLQRIAYINSTVYPFSSIPLLIYSLIPAICLLTDKFIISSVGTLAGLIFISLFLSTLASAILEVRWSGVSLEEWWRNQQFWVIGSVSGHLFAIIQGLMTAFSKFNTNFSVVSKAPNDDGEFHELYTIKWTALLIPPTTIIVFNIIGIVAGFTDAMNSGEHSWGTLLGKLFFSLWVIVHMYPFLKGLMGRQNRTPTLVVIWSVLLASIFSLVWVRVDPFVLKTKGPDVKQCGISC
ncbi:unnamed protein product [Lupinus luteus]|uniref:Cellulose synthase n=1 Tax=Lupinus luteus TaxID=3873 RepID=A0AAV1W6N6_LUPLU